MTRAHSTDHRLDAPIAEPTSRASTAGRFSDWVKRSAIPFPRLRLRAKPPSGHPAYPGWIRVRAECRNCGAHNMVDVLNAGVTPDDPIIGRCGVCGGLREMVVLVVGDTWG